MVLTYYVYIDSTYTHVKWLAKEHEVGCRFKTYPIFLTFNNENLLNATKISTHVINDRKLIFVSILRNLK